MTLKQKPCHFEHTASVTTICNACEKRFRKSSPFQHVCPTCQRDIRHSGHAYSHRTRRIGKVCPSCGHLYIRLLDTQCVCVDCLKEVAAHVH
jgi:hypothetical protein